jgi:hypothetical protein
MEVHHGRGAETYVNAEGMQVHWVDVLTLLVATLLALIVLFTATAIFNWRKKRDLALIKKLEAENEAAALGNGLIVVSCGGQEKQASRPRIGITKGASLV